MRNMVRSALAFFALGLGCNKSADTPPQPEGPRPPDEVTFYVPGMT